MIFLMFASWKTSPSPRIKEVYERVMPFVHMLLVVVVFAVIPTTIVLNTLIRMNDIAASQLTGPLLIYCFTSIAIYVWIPM